MLSSTDLSVLRGHVPGLPTARTRVCHRCYLCQSRQAGPGTHQGAASSLHGGAQHEAAGQQAARGRPAGGLVGHLVLATTGRARSHREGQAPSVCRRIRWLCIFRRTSSRPQPSHVGHVPHCSRTTKISQLLRTPPRWRGARGKMRSLWAALALLAGVLIGGGGALGASRWLS